MATDLFGGVDIIGMVSRVTDTTTNLLSGGGENKGLVGRLADAGLKAINTPKNPSTTTQAFPDFSGSLVALKAQQGREGVSPDAPQSSSFIENRQFWTELMRKYAVEAAATIVSRPEVSAKDLLKQIRKGQ